MIHFTYHAPTKVVFQQEGELLCAQLLQEFGAHKVLVHYGGQSALRNGLLHRVCQCLQEAELPYVTLGGVTPNPRLSKVREGVALAKQEGVDFILAIGGGSVIDSAKAIAYGCVNDGDLWDYYSRKKSVCGALPVGCIATAAAAGSEMSNSSVITNEDGWLKRGLTTPYGFCRFAILNPSLTKTLSMYQTMSGCVDILMHTLERYFTREETLELNDEIAYALMRNVIRHARILLKDPQNERSRSEILWASELSHNGVSGDRTLGDWACHQLEHELSGMFDVAHGAGLSAIWGSWARYVLESDPMRFAQLAAHVWGIDDKQEPRAAALAGIAAMEAFFQEIGMPVNLAQLGLSLSEEQIETLTEKCTHFHQRTIGAFRTLGEDDIRAIYQSANQA